MSDYKDDTSINKIGTTLTATAVSAVASATIANLAGPSAPLFGAAMGAIGGKCIELFADLATRSLSHKEKVRIGDTADFIHAKISKYLEAGKQPRADWIAEGTGATCAKEIFEGVLLKVKNEHEEKKNQFTANLFVNSIFTPDVTAAEANHFLSISNKLTYRQFCILAFYMRHQQHLKSAVSAYDQKKISSINSSTHESLSHEIFALIQDGLLKSQSSIANSEVLSSLMRSKMLRIWTTPLGIRFHTIMGLDDLPEDEMNEIKHFLL